MDLDWKAVEARLVAEAEGVCRHLLPDGRRVAHEWCVGSVKGEPGDSLKINLEGKAGVWADFASGEKGKSLLGLWCGVRGCAFGVAMGEAKAFLGIADEWAQRSRRVSPAGSAVRNDEGRMSNDERNPKAEREEAAARAPVSEVWGRCEVLAEGGPVWKELVERRGIEPAVLGVYGVREVPLRGGCWAMVFPYFGPEAGAVERSAVEVAIAARSYPDGAMGNDEGRMSNDERNPKSEVSNGARVPAWLKFERLDRVEGKKVEWTTRGPEKCLWGMEARGNPMFKRADHLLICEGEKDALSWASYGCGGWRVSGGGLGLGGGVLPVSVPFGAKFRTVRSGGNGGERPSPNREWLDRCWEWMQGFETIFVGMDMDEAGRRAAADIITEIGPRRCRLVELPFNENAK